MAKPGSIIKSKQKPFNNPQVAEVFNSYPKEVKTKLLFLRQLIFETASSLKEVGELEETLRWGEPSYITSKSKSGSLIRIDKKKAKEDKYVMYFHCQTNLVDTFKQLYSDKFKFEGNRSIIFNINDKIPVKELKHCISIALTYHLNK